MGSSRATESGDFSIWVDNDGTGVPKTANVSPDLVIRALSDLVRKI